MKYYINKYESDGHLNSGYFTDVNAAACNAKDYEDEEGNVFKYLSTDVRVDGVVVEQDFFGVGV